MTDNEIIKALEICINNEELSCKDKNCPCFKLCAKDIDALEKQTLDLINRQKAEIERLKEGIKFERERVDNIPNLMSEAIKGFAERLKNEIISDTAYGCDTNQHTGYYDYQIKIGDIPEYIDNLVKEMTEQKGR